MHIIISCLPGGIGREPRIWGGIVCLAESGGLAFGVGLFAWWGRGGGWGDLWAVSQVKSLTRMWCLAFRGLSCS